MAAINQTTMEKAPFPSPTKKWHDTTYASLSPSRPELSAEGKTVVITGGGTGIGAETARQFAAAGASRIALIGRREQPLLETKATIAASFPSVEVFVAAADASIKEQLDAAFDGFLHDSAKLDIVISAAGAAGPREAPEHIDGQAFIEAVNVNLLGALHTSKAFLRHAAKGAVAVDVSSIVTHVNFGDVFPSYFCAKISASRLWSSIGVTHPEISVFHVHPGVVDTPMTQESGAVEAAGFEDHVSLPATFFVWLVSPEARFLKGKFLWANWDVDELKARADELHSGSMLTLGLVGWPFGLE